MQYACSAFAVQRSAHARDERNVLEARLVIEHARESGHRQQRPALWRCLARVQERLHRRTQQQHEAQRLLRCRLAATAAAAAAASVAASAAYGAKAAGADVIPRGSGLQHLAQRAQATRAICAAGGDRAVQ